MIKKSLIISVVMSASASVNPCWAMCCWDWFSEEKPTKSHSFVNGRVVESESRHNVDQSTPLVQKDSPADLSARVVEGIENQAYNQFAPKVAEQIKIQQQSWEEQSKVVQVGTLSLRLAPTMEITRHDDRSISFGSREAFDAHVFPSGEAALKSNEKVRSKLANPIVRRQEDCNKNLAKAIAIAKSKAQDSEEVAAKTEEATNFVENIIQQAYESGTLKTKFLINEQDKQAIAFFDWRKEDGTQSGAMVVTIPWMDLSNVQ